MGTRTIEPARMAQNLPGRADGASDAGHRGALALSDLRRKRRREVVALVLERADRLPENERNLLRAVLADGRSIAEVARIRGESARSTSRSRVDRSSARARSGPSAPAPPDRR